MSLLEGGGGLAGSIMVVEEVSKVGSAVLWVDNIGAVWAVVNQSSRSMLVYTVIKAILDFSDGLGVRVKICLTGRRTGKGERVADHLSKGDLDKATLEAGLRKKMRTKMSNTLARWFMHAAPELYLGRRGLLEVAGRVKVYTGLDYDLL